MSLSDRGLSPSKSSSKSRWDWARLDKLKPFAKSVRHITEFYIQPDDPHRHYSPGDVVTGNVILKVVKPVDITHIVICLHGFAQVYKRPNEPGEGYRNYNAALIAGKTNKAGGYYGNGFVSLFEDEIVLCGDGRLDEGTYQFGFELHFPQTHLPSGIDFERGTISYMISCTLTRPSRASIINPVQTCERRITFIDNVDVATIAEPRPTTITLSPLPRRARTRAKRPSPKDSIIDKVPASTDGEAPSNPSDITLQESQGPEEPGSEQTDIEVPRSPGPSETSFGSGRSSGETPSGITSMSQVSQSARTTDSSGRIRVSVPAPSGDLLKPITTVIKIGKAGYLRGDTIDVHVTVDHTKHIKSLHGVIATLYRQARVDFFPSLPQINKDDDGQGLGKAALKNLRFSANGGLHLFRKPLDQSFASIIINPSSMRAEVKTTLTIPIDAFPTISTVPGAMISFKYYVDVICDVQGKLTQYDKYLPTPGLSSLNGVRVNPGGIIANGAHSGNPAWNYVNTEDLKRERSVVSCNFEIIIGSRDTSRNGKWSTPAHTGTLLDHDGPWQSVAPTVASSTCSAPSERPIRPVLSHHNTNVTVGESSSINPPRDFVSSSQPTITQSLPDFSQTPRLPSAAPEYVEIPIPRLPDESHLSDKERIRLAEQRLLPGAPPPLDDSVPKETSPAQDHAPSAPTFDDLAPLNPANAHHRYHFDDRPSRDEIPAYPTNVPPYDHHLHHQPASMPTLVPPAHEDKQELERRRLEAARSEPLPAEAGAEARPSVPPLDSEGEHEHAPSAPVLGEDEAMFGFSHSHHPGDELPRYER